MRNKSNRINARRLFTLAKETKNSSVITTISTVWKVQTNFFHIVSDSQECLSHTTKRVGQKIRNLTKSQHTLLKVLTKQP